MQQKRALATVQKSITKKTPFPENDPANFVGYFVSFFYERIKMSKLVAFTFVINTRMK